MILKIHAQLLSGYYQFAIYAKFREYKEFIVNMEITRVLVLRDSFVQVAFKFFSTSLYNVTPQPNH